MVGGEDNNISKIRPVLRCFGDEITHAGPLGSGLKLKLVNNYMSMIGMVMTAEALNLADILGLDQSQTVATLRKTPAGQGQLNTNFPKKVLSGDIAPDFPLRMGFKDISLGLNLAKSVGAASPLGTAAHAMFAQAGLVGRSEQDCTAMLHVLNELSASPPIRSETQLAD
jgi:4-hydroxybutyrate dehydrogenase/sulfolactaldehyde 3-reductase